MPSTVRAFERVVSPTLPMPHSRTWIARNWRRRPVPAAVDPARFTGSVLVDGHAMLLRLSALIGRTCVDQARTRRSSFAHWLIDACRARPPAGLKPTRQIHRGTRTHARAWAGRLRVAVSPTMEITVRHPGPCAQATRRGVAIWRLVPAVLKHDLDGCVSQATRRLTGNGYRRVTPVARLASASQR